MNAMKMAQAIADRAYTGWAHCGEELHRKIKVVAINVLATSEAEARLRERELAILKSAHKGTSALLRIEVNSLKVSRARAERQAADNAVFYLDLRLAISKWEGRTGLDHNALLAGNLIEPLGTQDE